MQVYCDNVSVRGDWFFTRVFSHVPTVQRVGTVDGSTTTSGEMGRGEESDSFKETTRIMVSFDATVLLCNFYSCSKRDNRLKNTSLCEILVSNSILPVPLEYIIYDRIGLRFRRRDDQITTSMKQHVKIYFSLCTIQ